MMPLYWRLANRNFEVLGTNMTSELCTFNTSGGITMTTAGGANDQAILAPHLDTNQTSWTSTLFGTHNELEFQTSVSIDSISNSTFWVGLKLTNTPVIATDADQAFFVFDTQNKTSASLTTAQIFILFAC